MSNFELEQPPVDAEIDLVVMGRTDWSQPVSHEQRQANYETIDHMTRPQSEQVKLLGFQAIEGLARRPQQIQEIIETRGI